MKMSLPPALYQMAEIFKENDHSLYLVGGAVRDYLLGKQNHDYDFTTDALPEEVKAMFRKTVDTGIKHGTVTVLFKGEGYEITTFRTEGDYSDSRHPDSVTFVRSLEEDLKRRDFTINALAYDLFSDKIIDLHNGVEDLKKRIIRAIGEPKERFTEDALRMMRACRFSAKLGFLIEKNTSNAIKELKDRITLVSEERIREEFYALVSSPYPRMGLEAMKELGLMEILFPELYSTTTVEGSGWHKESLYEHLLLTLENSRDLNAPLSVKLASLFHDIGKTKCQSYDGTRYHYFGHEIEGEKMVKAIMERLKASNSERDQVSLLVREHMIQYDSKWTDGAVKRLIIRIGKDNLENLFLLRKADRKATLNIPENVNDDELKRRIKEIESSNPPLSLKDLAIGGKELSLFMQKGPLMGKTLNYLLDLVLDNPKLNTKEILLEKAQEYYKLTN